MRWEEGNTQWISIHALRPINTESGDPELKYIGEKFQDKNDFIIDRVHPKTSPLFYTPYHLSELQSFKSIISTDISGIFIFK